MAKITTIFACLCIVMLFCEAYSIFWGRRRRRRRRRPPPVPPPCVPRDCRVSSWSGWGGCSYPCGTSGTRSKSRYVTSSQNSCGSCPYVLSQSQACNRNRCNPPNSVGSHSTGCYCRVGFTGTCCNLGESD